VWALIVLPLLSCRRLATAWVRIIDTALLYVLLAIGLNIVVGYAGLLDLGYVAFFAVGAYMFGLLGFAPPAEVFLVICVRFPNGLHTLSVAGRCRSVRVPRWVVGACCWGRPR
jgi:branched-chain amino acid transport system permease protein